MNPKPITSDTYEIANWELKEINGEKCWSALFKVLLLDEERDFELQVFEEDAQWVDKNQAGLIDAINDDLDFFSIEIEDENDVVGLSTQGVVDKVDYNLYLWG